MPSRRTTMRAFGRWPLAAIGLACACGSSDADPSGNDASVDARAPAADASLPRDAAAMGDAPLDGTATGASDATSSGHRGFPSAGPWVSFYGGAAGVDLAKVASVFRIINIDVDPGGGSFTDADIAVLRAGGRNRVISYLDVGSCEDSRSYWMTDPPGHESCVSSGALTTAYAGYPHEKWANLSSAAYRDLIVNYVAPRLAARGIDGFFLDNLEVVEHGAAAAEGPCDAACAQGGLDLVWELRQRFPDLLVVMQNATGDVTRKGTTHGVAYPSLLDGISHEEVYTAGADPTSRSEMLAWKGMGLTVNGLPFWLGAEDYVGSCSAPAKPEEASIAQEATADGLSSYVTDASGAQTAPCFWADLP